MYVSKTNAYANNIVNRSLPNSAPAYFWELFPDIQQVLHKYSYSPAGKVLSTFVSVQIFRLDEDSIVLASGVIWLLQYC